MSTIATLAIRLSAQLDDFKKAFADTSKTVSKFGAEFEGVATRAAAVGSFFGTIAAGIARSIAAGLGRAVSDAVSLSAQFSNALIGLSSVARAFGVDVDAAKNAARQLSADGLMPLKDSAAGLKNLLASGFNLDQSVQLMNAFKDSAAFGRQGALSFGDAIRSATEGVKNGNSILVDNAGVTKNLSQILKEAGFSAQDLSRASTDAGVRMALFNGILKETRAQTGDAERLTMTYTGQVSRLSTAYNSVLATMGAAITENKSVALAIKAVGDVFADLNTKLVTNRNAFNLVSDGVVFLAKAMSTTLNMIDVLQTAFAGLQMGANRLFEAFANIGIAAFKMTERVELVQKVMDPINFTRHAAAANEAREAYTFLGGAAQGFRDSSAAAEARAASWGNTLQTVRARVDALAVQLANARGQTVSLGESGTKMGHDVGDGTEKAGNFLKNFQKAARQLETELQAAAKAGVPMQIILEEYKNQIEEITHKAPIFGQAIGEATQRAAKALEDADFAKILKKANKELDVDARQLLDKWKTLGAEAGKKLTEEQAKSNKAFLANGLELQKGLTQLEDDSLAKRLELIRIEYAQRRQAVIDRGVLVTENLALIDMEERKAAEEATAAWRQHVADVAAAANTYPNIFKHALANIPNLIQQALTGGGGFKGAGESMLSGLGGALGGHLFTDMTRHLSNTFSKIGTGFTKFMGDFLPGIGAALGAMIGPLVSKLFGTAGRDAVKAFAAEFKGGFDGPDGLHETLIAKLGDVGEDFWKKLTQATGRKDKAGAEALIAQIKQALADSPASAAEAAGYKTIKALQATADKAREIYEYMRDSGLYSAEAIADAFEKSKDAQIAALDTAGRSAYNAAVKTRDMAKAVIDELDGQIKSLQDSIAGEAEEEFKGMIQLQQEAQLADLLKKRQAAQADLDNAEDQIQHAVDAAVAAAKNAAAAAGQQTVDGIQDALDRADFRVKVKLSMTGLPYGEAPEPGEGAATGGYIGAGGTLYRALGGPAYWQPRGTDTVPAMTTSGQPLMLTPHEGILNIRAMSDIGADGLHALNSGRFIEMLKADLALRTQPSGAAPTPGGDVIIHVPPGELTRAMETGTPIVIAKIQGNYRGAGTQLQHRGVPVGGF